MLVTPWLDCTARTLGVLGNCCEGRSLVSVPKVPAAKACHACHAVQFWLHYGVEAKRRRDRKRQTLRGQINFIKDPIAVAGNKRIHHTLATADYAGVKIKRFGL